MDLQPAYLSAFIPRHPGAGVRGVQLQLTTVTDGAQRVCERYSTSPVAFATTATGYAAMAVNVGQPVAFEFPVELSSTSATHSASIAWVASNAPHRDTTYCDANLGVVNEVDDRTAPDID